MIMRNVSCSLKVMAFGFTAMCLMVTFLSCKKEPDLPSLYTLPVVEIKQTSAISGGILRNDGGAPVSAMGLCWSTNQNPTVADMFSQEESGIKEFKFSMTGLMPGTVYYVRVYATNSKGTGYGNEQDFETPPGPPPITFNPDLTYGSISDVDGNTYKTIQIGTQIWMAENLKTTKYNDNTPIPFATNWEQMTNLNGAYSWYENEPGYKAVYGALYSGCAVRSDKLCPVGWRIPEMTEYAALVNYLGGINIADRQFTIAAGKLKEAGTAHWESPNVVATNVSGFTAVPGGYNVSLSVHFFDIGIFCFLWANSIEGVNRLGYVEIHHTDYFNFQDSWDDGSLQDGFSVRCIKD